MLQSAYLEPHWTPARLIRTVFITLISGVVAGVALPCNEYAQMAHVMNPNL